MAVTKGHGNPKWSKDEIILALNLYFKIGMVVPDHTNEEVIKLSNLLRQNPLHPDSARKASFRNPTGVAMKVINLYAAHTGKGLNKTSKLDRQVWEEYGNKPDVVARLANDIEQAIIELPAITGQPYESEDAGYDEGQLVLRLHKHRERSSQIKPALIKQRKQDGRLHCEICEAKPKFSSGKLEAAEFDAHHIIPLSKRTKGEKTKLSDVALLCCNCHRLIHRLMSSRSEWLSIDDAKSYLESPND